jgi:hypothetical protein
MIELDAQTCAFERLGGPSFEMLAADVVIYEKTGVLHVIGPLAEASGRAAQGLGVVKSSDRPVTHVAAWMQPWGVSWHW